MIKMATSGENLWPLSKFATLPHSRGLLWAAFTVHLLGDTEEEPVLLDSLAEVSAFHHDLVRGASNFMALKSDWERLVERCQSIARPFLQHEWTQLWLEYFGTTYEPLIFRIYRGHQLIALAPFYEYPNPQVGSLWTTLSLMGDFGGDYRDLIIDAHVDNRAAVYAYTLKILSQMRRRPSLLRLQNLVWSDAGLLIPEAFPGAISEEALRPYVDTRRLPWSEYHGHIREEPAAGATAGKIFRCPRISGGARRGTR